MTNEQKITAAEVRQLFEYDPETGLFTNRFTRGGNAMQGAVAGTPHGRGYTSIKVSGSLYLAHRLAWLYITGAWPAGTIDHKNGVRNDNRFSNLRDVPHAVNTQNRRSAQANNVLGALGVSRKGSGFVAKIQIGGKRIHVGRFKTEDAAHEAYLKKKREIHEGCTI